MSSTTDNTRRISAAATVSRPVTITLSAIAIRRRAMGSISRPCPVDAASSKSIIALRRYERLSCGSLYRRSTKGSGSSFRSISSTTCPNAISGRATPTFRMNAPYRNRMRVPIRAHRTTLAPSSITPFLSGTPVLWRSPLPAEVSVATTSKVCSSGSVMNWSIHAALSASPVPVTHTTGTLCSPVNAVTLVTGSNPIKGFDIAPLAQSAAF